MVLPHSPSNAETRARRHRHRQRRRVHRHAGARHLQVGKQKARSTCPQHSQAPSSPPSCWCVLPEVLARQTGSTRSVTAPAVHDPHDTNLAAADTNSTPNGHSLCSWGWAGTGPGGRVPSAMASGAKANSRCQVKLVWFLFCSRAWARTGPGGRTPSAAAACWAPSAATSSTPTASCWTRALLVRLRSQPFLVMYSCWFVDASGTVGSHVINAHRLLLDAQAQLSAHIARLVFDGQLSHR